MKHFFCSRWRSVRLASLFHENTAKNEGFLSSNALQFRYGNIVPKKKFDLTSDLIETYKKYTLIQPGDIMINGLNLNYDFVTQRVAIVPSSGIITSAYICLRPRDNVNFRFYTYYLKALDFIKVFNGLGTGIRLTLSYDSIKNMVLPIPPRTEQDQIVRYLDWQVSKINRLIAAKRKKIALFEELKTHQTIDAVLHGVKQYKKYIETQEFGRIPAHWQIYQNKRLFRERVEHSEMGTETLLSVSKHYGVKPSADLTEDEQFATIKPALSLAGYKVVHKNDLVMNIMRARNGSYGISAYNGIVSPAYCIYYVTKNCNVKYLHYFLRTPHVKSLFEAYSSGIAEHRRRLYPEDFLRLTSVFPPIEEQNEIVEYIEQSLVKYDEAITNLKRQIACLQDMKTHLISDVVTGQIDVRDIKVPDNEYINNEITEEEFEEESENNEEE